MSTMILIRNVPDALHHELEARAAREGVSLLDYLLREIRQVAERPTLEEMRARPHNRPRTSSAVDTAEAVRAERDSR